MMKIGLWAACVSFAASQQLARDPGVDGVEAEVVHLYYDEYPQGTTVTYILPCVPLHGFSLGTRYCCISQWPAFLELRSLA